MGDVDEENFEYIMIQESLYQSLQTSDGRTTTTTTTTTTSVPDESSQAVHDDQFDQLELDAAFAMSIQELENQLVNIEDNATNTTTSTSVEAAERQDNVDDPTANMTYEQLQSLEEAIGSESKGLSDELIAQLPTFKYKTGGFFFPKKKKHEECVICCMEYKNREMLTTLPCLHQYHSKCITQWLKLNKVCPVCNKEICIS